MVVHWSVRPQPLEAARRTCPLTSCWEALLSPPSLEHSRTELGWEWGVWVSIPPSF